MKDKFKSEFGATMEEFIEDIKKDDVIKEEVMEEVKSEDMKYDTSQII